jgi:protoporphyrin/coproporphyrin ferrochelatase
MSEKKTGVLLANLGSPTAPTTSAVRKFLKDFLGDPRVVNIPRPVWWVILHCFVLPFRPAKSARAYQKVWTDKGSPLIYLTRQLSEKLTGKFQPKGVAVTYAMRYGEPSIGNQLKSLRQQGVNDIVVLPLYPQYSSTTTASIYDDVIKEFNEWRHLPSFQFISDYHCHDNYISAIVESVKSSWLEHGKNELLLMSFHGLPELLTKLGDPYYSQCQETARLIAQKLGLNEKQWVLVFQSRFGKAEWLKPYCVDTLQKLPAQGIKTIDVICPGFSVDCLETLEEMAMENKSVFLEAGGEAYRYIPALNDSESHVNAIADLLDGWI